MLQVRMIGYNQRQHDVLLSLSLPRHYYQGMEKVDTDTAQSMMVSSQHYYSNQCQHNHVDFISILSSSYYDYHHHTIIIPIFIIVVTVSLVTKSSSPQPLSLL